MRTHADNPIAIHHQAGRYTTIASLSLIIFFLLFVFSCSRSKTTHVTAVYRPRIQLCRPEWLPVDERRAWLLSSIKCHRRGQTLSAKSRRFVGVPTSVEICRRATRESDATETRSIKNPSHKQKLFDEKDRI